MAVVNELVTKFTYQGSTAPVNNYVQGIGQAFSVLAKFTAVAGIAVAGIGAMINQAAEHGDMLSDLSQRTGIATDNLQVLGYVAQLNGSSFEAMNSSLEGLNRQIGLAASGGKLQEDTFKELGISIKDGTGKIKSADTVFAEMQQRMKSMGYGTQQVAAVLRKLRLDPTLAQTLNLSAEEMANFSKEARDAGILSKEQIAAASEFEDSLDRMKVRLMAVGNQFMLNLAPALSNFMDNMGSIIAYVSAFIGNIIQLVSNVGKAIDATIGWQAGLAIASAAIIYFNRVALTGMIINFRALAVAMWANPITWWIAGIVALALVVEDLYQAFTGGESAIGDFFAKFDIDIVNTMIDGFNMLMRIVSPIGLGFIGLGLIITGVFKTAAQFMNMFGAGINLSGLDAMTKKLSEQSVYMQGIATGDNQAVANRAAYVPSAPTPQGAKPASATNVQNTVTITGVSDPQKAAQLTSAELAKQNRAAVTQRGNSGI